MQPTLTDYNKKAHALILAFFRTNGYYPSCRELAKKLKIATTNARLQIIKLKTFKLLKTNPHGRIIYAEPITL